jgi:hypothetical protein
MPDILGPGIHLHAAHSILSLSMQIMISIVIPIIIQITVITKEYSKNGYENKYSRMIKIKIIAILAKETFPT